MRKVVTRFNFSCNLIGNRQQSLTGHIVKRYVTPYDMDRIEFNENEIIEALKRSGYLLESEISKILAKAGFFVETNQVIEDPLTGKSREIDLIAEYYEHDERRTISKCVSKVHFVFEIKNNSAPIVLLTKFEHSPNIEDWLGLKECITIPKGIKYDLHDAYWKRLVYKEKYSIFTQYCSFQKKKENSELMALHPDNIHDGLSKICQYCEEAIGEREIEEMAGGYLRHFIYVPVLLIAEDLFELEYSEENNPKLKKVETSILVYNYHYKKQPSMAYIFIVTKKGFPDFMHSMIELENTIELEMIANRIKGVT